MKNRYLTSFIQADLKKKMVFLSGPRQSGKTTLALHLLGKQKDRYFNWDNDEHRESILKRELPSSKGLIVFDEIHKFSRWRNWIKGIFDTRKDELDILVTGSAKLDYYRKGGDSLQGRYNHYRLHPLSLAELKGNTETLHDLLKFGGFPEPYFSKSETETRKWSRQYRTRLVREEINSLEKVADITRLEELLIRLPECVGSPLSLNALREDLQVSHEAITRWMLIFENNYAIFRIYPFGSPKIRALKKEPKHYHYDWTQIESPGARFENLMACHLLKWCHFIEDTQGFDMELRYFRDREKREVDFVVLKNRKPIMFIEAKTSDSKCSLDLIYLKKKFPEVDAIQVVLNEEKDIKNEWGIRICGATSFLKDLI